MFCSHFGAAVAKIFNKYEEISPLKCFWKPWVCFLILIFKENRLNNIYPSSNITYDRSNFDETLLFSRNSRWESKLRVFKNFWEDIFLHLLNIFATATQNENKKYILILTDVNYQNWLDA